MEFVDDPLPDCVQLGAQSNPEWQTLVTTNIGGFDATNQDWEDARHTFDISYAVQDVADYMIVRSHFHSMRGRAKSFPFKDFLDYAVTAVQGALLDDGASPAGDYQMYRRYGTWDRIITKPRSGTISVFRLRASVTSDATADASISYTTGLVTMANHAGGDTYTWSGEFWVPVRYDIDKLPGIAVDRTAADGVLLVQCDSIMLVEVREG